ncbi:MAG: hypothetical protein KPEEDBHJ_03176 [Anaerolineales bacterium]|nr:hypothetical protein [Anaerolineales bacterium]
MPGGSTQKIPQNRVVCPKRYSLIGGIIAGLEEIVKYL